MIVDSRGSWRSSTCLTPSPASGPSGTSSATVTSWGAPQHPRASARLRHARGVRERGAHVGGVRPPFDLCITASQLAGDDARQALPEIRFILDHCGKPDIARGSFDEWRHRIDALAEFDTVCCKLSGLFTGGRSGRCDADTLRPYVSTWSRPTVRSV
ncbi:MAG: amidohydrolase family protein [Gemmatimonadetes bacterium]|nr:amidohydrolase family protein [Gemmatimonadota bacterium]